MAEPWTHLLERWIRAGLIDVETAERIRAFERGHAGSNRLRWPIWLALTFGGLAVGAGVLLFVSANWDAISPSTRFAIVLSLVAGFHLAAAAAAERFRAMATALHAIGTVALGAGIFLGGQIFNLEEHWPGGLMLWALGATIAWALLRSWPQLALTALLIPAWLVGEWSVAVDNWSTVGARVTAVGVFLLALTYSSAMAAGAANMPRRTLVWIGRIALLPAGLALAAVSARTGDGPPAPPAALLALGWAAALLLPLALAYALRQSTAWMNGVAAVWMLVLLALDPLDAPDLLLYVWWAVGAIGLAAWGVFDADIGRINAGAAAFLGTVLAFYFGQVMDKLGRSASLIGLGLLLLATGWAIERARRRLVLRVKGEEPA